MTDQVGLGNHAGNHNRQNKNRKQRQIQRKQPARGAQMAQVIIFYHAGMELTGQAENRHHGEQ